MEEDPRQRELTEKILAAIKKEYGFIPLINQVLAERPDLFVPAANLGRAAVEGRGVMEKKTRYLCALAAASAEGAEHCIRVQVEHAMREGATKDEILEAMVIGSYMSMTKAQSYAFREYAKIFNLNTE
ncbi:MAG: carboxymuconolactone decarboxylase family protein [Candidatus Methanomethylophilaceae archaeon]|jgi:AhpD family alkylhydroperoxidase